jgi:hypothetical protein
MVQVIWVSPARRQVVGHLDVEVAKRPFRQSGHEDARQLPRLCIRNSQTKCDV